MLSNTEYIFILCLIIHYFNSFSLSAFPLFILLSFHPFIPPSFHSFILTFFHFFINSFILLSFLLHKRLHYRPPLLLPTPPEQIFNSVISMIMYAQLFNYEKIHQFDSWLDEKCKQLNNNNQG